jgi:hypothetical protein
VAAVGPPVQARGGGVMSMALGPEGDGVYLAIAGELVRYSITADAVTARVPLPATGRLSVSPRGDRVFLADQGIGRHVPSSGRVFVYDAALNAQAPIDLSSALVGDIPPTLQQALASPDGGTLFVTAGTGSRGPLYGPQRARVFVVDLPDRRLIREVPLDAYFPAILLWRDPSEAG